MNAPVKSTKPTLALPRQIEEAARHLAECKRSIGERRAALGQRVHARLTSPATLFFAGAGGYLFGEFVHRKGKAGPPKASRPAPRSGAKANLILKIALQLVAWLNLATAAATRHDRQVSEPASKAAKDDAGTRAVSQRVH